MASAKRCFESEEDKTDLQKKFKSNKDNDTLDHFLEWCKHGKLTLSEKVSVSKEGSCAQYGMIASEDIDKGETLFEIPRPLILNEKTCSIAQLLKDEADSLKSESGWVPLLIALLHEYNKPDSKWKPYLQCFPDFRELDLPMFWPQDIINKELSGTGVIEAVNKDMKGISHEFIKIVLPFISKHPDLFPAECREMNTYKKMVAFVMAYSFTEPVTQEEDDDDDFDYEIKSPPMMVPMADALNHVAKNNAKLKFGKESLKMVACKPIKKREEVYNTYGQISNLQLLHMYGFAEPYPNNQFDTVDIPVSLMYEILTKKPGVDIKFLKEKWNFLKSSDIVADDGSFIIGCEGILTEDETAHALKVLCMNMKEFGEHQENEGWVEDEEEEDDDSMTFDSITKLSKEKKDILKCIAEECLDGYSTTLNEEENKLKNTQLTTRQRHCVHVRYGQLKILHKLIDACSLQNDSTLEGGIAQQSTKDENIPADNLT